MLQAFFKSVIKLWLPSQKYTAASVAAFAFLIWLRELKKPVFLPGRNKQDQIWRLKQVKKSINKMPVLTLAFHTGLAEIKERPQNFPLSEWNLILEKRGNVAPFVFWLKTLTADDVTKLQALLNEAPELNPNWIRRKNKKSI